MGDDERQEDRHQRRKWWDCLCNDQRRNQSNGVIHVIDGVVLRSN